jgi:hypothetical protein
MIETASLSFLVDTLALPDPQGVLIWIERESDRVVPATQ